MTRRVLLSLVPGGLLLRLLLSLFRGRLPCLLPEALDPVVNKGNLHFNLQQPFLQHLFVALICQHFHWTPLHLGNTLPSMLQMSIQKEIVLHRWQR